MCLVRLKYLVHFDFKSKQKIDYQACNPFQVEVSGVVWREHVGKSFHHFPSPEINFLKCKLSCDIGLST